MKANSAPRRGGRRAARRPKGSGGRAEEIKAVALRLFAERDFDRVTIKDIARACGINTALIYYYFESKEDLFRAAVEYGITRAAGRYGRLREGSDDPVQRIGQWFDIHARPAAATRELLRILLRYAFSELRFASVDGLIKRFREGERRILAESIRAGIALGRFQPVDAERVTRFVSSHLGGVELAAVMRWSRDRRAMVGELEAWLWDHLGYPRRSRVPGGPSAGAERAAQR